MSQGRVFARALSTLDRTDQMSPSLRECVHEYGYAVVVAMLDAGIREARHIHNIMHEVRCGPRSSMQRVYRQDPGSVVLNRLDAMLIADGCTIPAAAIVRFFRTTSLVVLPIDPSPPMVAASLDATNHMGRVTKEQKHRNRLRSAISAGARHLWPFLEARQ